MSSPWEVHPYSKETLRDLLAQHSLVSRASLDSKLHCIYFDGYFDNLAAKTIVVEQGYVDRDFLEDFAAYYVRCFERYERFCTRLHFFDRSFGSSDFKSLLEGSSSPLDAKAVSESYLGFVVVKRLPRTIIGRTCLRTYPSAGRRHYPIIRQYDVSLFGLKLAVRTLAFQEQDRVAAACATSALWSAFHGTGILFHHHIPSPVEITTSASSSAFPGLRYLPSKGLTLMQMASAIRSVGLEPTHVHAGNLDIVRDTVYAYVRGGIPVMLVGTLSEHPVPAVPQPAELHAIVATGFSLGGAGGAAGSPPGFSSISARIDKVYCHDDQVGPFARMMVGGPLPICLSTSWQDTKGQMGSVWFQPQDILIPLYHKIRVPFETVQERVIRFNAFLSFWDNLLGGVLGGAVEWDTRLTTVNEFKTDIQASSLPAGPRRLLLERSLPRFIWRATGSQAGSATLDVLFDATGLDESDGSILLYSAKPGVFLVLEQLRGRGAIAGLGTTFELIG